LGTGFFVHYRMVSAVRSSLLAIGCHIVLKGHWCNIIVLNVHAPIEEKSDDSKHSVYEELEQVYDHFPKYYLKIVLGDFNAKVGRIFSNRQLGTRIYIRIVKIMVLE